MRVELRPLLPSDRAEFIAIHQRSEAALAPWSPQGPPDATWESLFERRLARAAEGSSWKGVGVLESGRIGGFFNLNEIVRGPFQNAYAGWSVDAELFGRGVGTAGVRALLAFAFAAPPLGLGLHRVQANIIPRNQASVRVAQKAGFRLEGLARRYLSIAGAWEDHAMYALTVEEHAGPDGD